MTVAATLTSWRDVFVQGGEDGLKSRTGEPSRLYTRRIGSPHGRPPRLAKQGFGATSGCGPVESARQMSNLSYSKEMRSLINHCKIMI